MHTHRHLLGFAALSAACAVGCGAFASHGLDAIKGEYAVRLWHTGSQYQLIHAIAVIIALLLNRQSPSRRYYYSALSLTAGNILFPGALYQLGWYGPSIVGAIAPLGGLAYICGWLLIALAAWTQTNHQTK